MIKVRNVEIGDGKPKIAVSLMARNDEELNELLLDFSKKSEMIDIVEMRADAWMSQNNINMKKIRKEIEDKILLYTFRTSKEGGLREITDDEYRKLILDEVDREGHLFDMIDLEINRCTDEMLRICREKKIKIIGSWHDYMGDYSISEMLKNIEKIASSDVDVIKYICMPKGIDDVMHVMEACIMTNENNDKPVIAHAMGEMGLVSRISAELTGSAIAYASIGQTVAAPGQIDVEELTKCLSVMHNELRKREDAHGTKD